MEAAKWVANFPALEYATRFTHDIVSSILRTGAIPRHIAFVMDGNRRFARKYNLESGEGHFAGFEAFLRTLQTCSQLGVHTVTVYAFSIENFNRSKEEADLLFNMLRTKVWDLVKDQDSAAHKAGWKFQVWGNRGMLEPDILSHIETMEDRTKDYTKMVVNICCPYTSRDDMTQAVVKKVKEVKEHTGSIDDIQLESYNNALYIGSSPPLDILIRTSGETRLSDFMCWESVEGTELHFVKTLWPEFSSWELYLIVLKWGYNHSVHNRKLPLTIDQLPAPPPKISVSDVRNRN